MKTKKEMYEDIEKYFYDKPYIDLLQAIYVMEDVAETEEQKIYLECLKEYQKNIDEECYEKYVDKEV